MAAIFVYISLVALSAILASFAPVWVALVVFILALGVALRPELKSSAVAFPYSIFLRG